MPSPGRLLSTLARGGVPLRTRVDLVRAEMRRRLRPKDAYPVRLGRGTVFLSDADYAIDWESFKFVAIDEAYPGDYAGAHVLDLGAHKGYYGAYALANGARSVVSFEPESANVELLERAAASYRATGSSWEVRQAAVGGERGVAELHVMGASWGHSLHPPDEWARHEVAVEQVAVEAAAEVLAEAAAWARGAPLVVKVNVEGEECSVVLGTEVEAWTAVSELYVEMHPWAACTGPEVAAHVAAAGLSEVPSAMAPVLRLRRGGSPRAGPRTGPS